ncbi:putative AIG1-type guanine nucleotide-binding (G) domain-containing protein [Helianthus annuus]|nr:putative AIG1-type guanine nucleotide-binding (G) domain-containing protein [Helianthus annuus]
MEGSSFEGDCEFSSSQTLVLVGRKGNGKSATGNNILGTKIFKSERRSSGVTSTCELKSTILKDGRMISVIDTPGSYVDTEFAEEIIKMAGNGDHLEKDDETLEDFLHDFPEKLKVVEFAYDILSLCENRCVLFDNKTEDQTKRSDQVEKLFSIVNMVSRKIDGKLYNNEMFTEWKVIPIF